MRTVSTPWLCALVTILAPAVLAADPVLDASFDVDADGFAYADSVFPSSRNPEHASGEWIDDGGFDGGALRVLFANVDGGPGCCLSGG